METICWNGHPFEYLQDQTTCGECGEYGQHGDVRRFAPGEAEEIAQRLEAVQAKYQVDFAYKRGYSKGFEAGILAERARKK